LATKTGRVLGQKVEHAQELKTAPAAE